MPPNTNARLLSLSNHIVRLSTTRAPRPNHRTTSFQSNSDVVEPNFPVSPVPKNPLGAGRYIQTAAALIIGDEILNGKTLDKNSHYFAQYCFEKGIDLKRVEVIADDEEEIIEASRRMVEKYDFVITSGGIGPTHDDITYQSLAKSFNQSLAHHSPTLKRMREYYKLRKWTAISVNEEQKAATKRMALFPEKAEVLFTGRDLWVPVVRLEGKLCVFPGIPFLFQKMLNGLTPFLPLPPPSERPLRLLIFTSRPESIIAPYLTSLQLRVRDKGIQVGSYPVLRKGVYVSLIGRNQALVRELATEVEAETDGQAVEQRNDGQKEGELDGSEE